MKRINITGSVGWFGIACSAALAVALPCRSAAAAPPGTYTDLYVMQGAELYEVSESNGAPTLIGQPNDWIGFTSFTAGDSYSAYAIQDGVIWRVSLYPDNVGAYDPVSEAGWTGPTQLAYGTYFRFLGSPPPPGTLWLKSPVNRLVAWQGGHLYKVNPDTGDVAHLTDRSWPGQAAMTYFDYSDDMDSNDLFVVQANSLFRINVHNGSYVPLNGDWSDTTAMTHDETSLYIACQNHLYKVNPATGSSTDLGPNWNTTTTLTFMDGWLYAIDGSDLFKVNPSTGSTTLLGSTNAWPGFTLMTSRHLVVHAPPP